jgi:predicted dehydrogenase
MKLNHIAIIGLGSIGRRHLRLIKQIRPEIKITVVRSGKGEHCAEEEIADNIVQSIKAATSLGIEAAIISTPSTFHLSNAITLLKSDIHLLIEKPLSNTMEYTEELVRLSKTSKAIILIGYVLRYDPAAIRFKQLLLEEDIGEKLHIRVECGSYLPDWRPDQDYKKTVSASTELGGGVLLELSHELDYINWFFGQPSDIQALLRNSKTLGIDVEDQVDILLSYENDCPISVQIDFCRRKPMRVCSVLTTKGQVTWNAMSKKVVSEWVGQEKKVNEFSFERDHIYQEQLIHFLDCIENKKTPAVTLNDGVDVMQMIDACRKSNNMNRKIKI